MNIFNSAPFKRPWRLEWTNFGESMGYDSRSRIVDADGRLITEIGNGVHELRGLHEATALSIIEAINLVKK